jgi:hypothetical protein
MCSLNRERFDYARVLISTSSLEVVNVSEKILVDGEMIEIKIVEEWGFCLGDDACLYEEDDKCESDISEAADINVGSGINADILANKMAKDVEDADDFFQSVDINVDEADLETLKTIDVNLKVDGSTASTKEVDETCASSNFHSGSDANNGHVFESFNNELPKNTNEGVKATVGGLTLEGDAASIGDSLGLPRKRRVRTISCSSEDAHSLRSGPWSVDWLQNVKWGDVRIIYSNKKRLKEGC